jgi:hypothetical protein
MRLSIALPGSSDWRRWLPERCYSGANAPEQRFCAKITGNRISKQSGRGTEHRESGADLGVSIWHNGHRPVE